MRNLHSLMTDPGHIVKIEEHRCRFGDSYRPWCIECAYLGPFVSHSRACAIADEHRRKSVDLWEPAR